MGRTINTGLSSTFDSSSRNELENKIDELQEHELMIEKLRKAKVKFKEDDVLFVVNDKTKQLVWLEKGNSSAGLEHIINGNGNTPGHVKDFIKKCNITKEEIPDFLKQVISKGDVIHSVKKIKNGKEGYEKIYQYKEKYFILSGIGSNGFIVTAYPISEKVVIKIKSRGK